MRLSILLRVGAVLRLRLVGDVVFRILDFVRVLEEVLVLRPGLVAPSWRDIG
jgi:hypothetical protein